jgi:hypothetical protein
MASTLVPDGFAPWKRIHWSGACTMLAGVLVTVVVSTSSPAATPLAFGADDTMMELQIDAGRLDAIMRNVEQGLDSGSPIAATGQRGAIQNDLVEAVLRYNANTVRACRRGDVPASFCRAAWNPSWLFEPATRVHSPDELRSMARETEARVVPFWEALCAGHGRLSYPMCEME